ncbi:HTH-type transcriptional regulator CysB [Agitococcus lubricus]|uniref:LysR family cys regulon transcriptional activator n=1 Tax=Agitococcus lubricus TaxID=1077255 RepID=A0A2T5IZU9_9GAMM|nr:HTH-type transcriptional regulator CysB [Agitococcus lubricus]PTQ89591.1 LysR family cys regulon transcriptional activator [Agitococcus lubricus]
MKLQQLRYICEVAANNLNVSTAAQNLYTSQPGVSKQIRLFEDELGIEIFTRNGKHLTQITNAGHEILQIAREVLRQVENIKQVGEEYSNPRLGKLSIATTHTQARYRLPPVIEKFRQFYPDVSLHLQQGTPQQIAQMASTGVVDFAIATEAMEHFTNLILLPCYKWNRSVVVPKNHPLTRIKTLSLENIADYPIVTYVFGFTGRSQLDQAFAQQGLSPKVVFTATDADVIKTYVKLGLGIGIVAHMAYEPAIDNDLVALDVSHLFPSSTTKIAFRRGMWLRSFMFDFMQTFAPHLTRARVESAILADTADEVEQIFADVNLPVL